MNREELRNNAVSRRNDVKSCIIEKINWVCTSCEREFVNETSFMKHRCKERERLEKLRSPLGQAAYNYYSEWMRQSKRSIPPIEKFSSSFLYTTFIKFAEYVIQVKIPNPVNFIRIMITNGNIQPTLWCRDNTYSIYLRSFDEAISPLEQFLNSIEIIQNISNELKISNKDVLQTLGLNEILNLVQRRKLSPWFLITSNSFKIFAEQLSKIDRSRLEEGIQLGAYLVRIQHEPIALNYFNEFIAATKELQL